MEGSEAAGEGDAALESGDCGGVAETEVVYVLDGDRKVRTWRLS